MSPALLSGMLLHTDGSHHQWFQDERWHDLIIDLNVRHLYEKLREEHQMILDELPPY